MKLIGNIFGFDCVTCEHNRDCYGGNMGNQFRYCQKSMEKVQSLDKLEQENKELREIIEKIHKILLREQPPALTKFHYDIVGLINELLTILKGVQK